jgi:hypothetical protein
VLLNNTPLPDSFFSFEGLSIDQDLDSTANLTSQTTMSVHGYGEASSHLLLMSIRLISWAAVSSVHSTSVPLLMTSVDVNALSATLCIYLPSSSLPLEPMLQAALVYSSSMSNSERSVQVTLKAKFEGQIYLGRRYSWNTALKVFTRGEWERKRVGIKQ